MKLELLRFPATHCGTFGLLTPADVTVPPFAFHTVERPWENNQPMISCVPEGEYRMIWQPTTTSVPDNFANDDSVMCTWYLDGETVTAGYSGKPRTRCAFHVANYASQVNGCVGVGRYLAVMGPSGGEVLSVADSGHALGQLLALIGPGDHELTIRRA